MYGCNCHIGCLSGSVTRVGSELRGRISRIGSDGNETLGLSGSVTRVGGGLRGYVSLVCSTNKDATLVVSKTAIELAYTGEAVSFDITSNTSWVIS